MAKWQLEERLRSGTDHQDAQDTPCHRCRRVRPEYLMGSERRKRHHYVPVFLQKHFCDADGMLWYGIRVTQEVKKVSPRHAFVEKELYTSYQATERSHDIAYEADDKYERQLAELERRAASAIGKLVAGISDLMDGGDADVLRRISPPEINACKELVVSMSNRTSEAMNSAIAQSRQALDDTIAELDLGPIQRFPRPVQAELIMRLEKSAMAHVASSSHFHAPEGLELNGFGLVVAAYPNSKSRFILGSCGVAHLPMPGDPTYPDGTWLPITSSHAIGLSNDRNTITLLKNREPLQRRINEALAKRSKLIAGNSRGLIEHHMGFMLVDSADDPEANGAPEPPDEVP